MTSHSGPPRRLLGALLALATTMALTLGLVTPAQAARTSDGVVTLNVRANTAVKRDTCHNAASYQLSVNKSRVAARTGAEYSTLDWTADVTISGPGGYYSEDFVWDDTSWQGIFLCEFPTRPGRYTVTAYVTADGWTWDSWSDGYYNYDSNLYSATIRQAVVLKNPANLASAKAPYRAHKWRTTGTLRSDGRVRPNQVVKLQRRAGTGWSTVRTLRTNRKGKATVIVRGRAGKFRWYYAGNSTTKGDTSPVFRLPRR